MDDFYQDVYNDFRNSLGDDYLKALGKDNMSEEEFNAMFNTAFQLAFRATFPDGSCTDRIMNAVFQNDDLSSVEPILREEVGGMKKKIQDAVSEVSELDWPYLCAALRLVLDEYERSLTTDGLRLRDLTLDALKPCRDGEIQINAIDFGELIRQSMQEDSE